MPEREYSPEEIAAMEKERILTAADLIKEGADYVPNPEKPQNPRLEVTAKQLVDAYTEGDRQKEARTEVRKAPKVNPNPEPNRMGTRVEEPIRKEPLDLEQESDVEAVREKILELCERYDEAYDEWKKYEDTIKQKRPDLYACFSEYPFYSVVLEDIKTELFDKLKKTDPSNKVELNRIIVVKGCQHRFHTLYQAEQILQSYPSNDETWHRTSEIIGKMAKIADSAVDYVGLRVYKNPVLQPSRKKDENAYTGYSMHIPKSIRDLREVRLAVVRHAKTGARDFVVATSVFLSEKKDKERDDLGNGVHLYSPSDWPDFPVGHDYKL